MFALLLPILTSVLPEIGKWIFGSTGETVTKEAMNIVKTITGKDDPTADDLNRAISDPKVEADLRVQLAKIAADAEKAKDDAFIAQLQAVTSTNNVEAASDKTFIAGWRPFIGWMCGVGLGFASIGVPIIQMFQGHPVAVDTGTLTSILLAMLGFGGMRTVEKVAG